MSQANEFEKEIHRRLLARDPIAPAELTDAYLQMVIEGISRRSGIHPEDPRVVEAAVDAMLGYLERPERFDPDKKSLLTYLNMAGRGDLLNALDRERRAQRLLEPLELVEESEDGRNSLQERADVATYDEYNLGDDLPAELRTALRAEFPDPVDWTLVELIVDGERRTDVFAEVLGVSALDKLERERIVKQHKDRVKKRLARLKDKLRGQEV